ncbi:DUF2911 domain-containing protein [bacterium SCSIO 12741]|nr:DUF2911 domain-containing protein [bacterium SCSIO 12741]
MKNLFAMGALLLALTIQSTGYAQEIKTPRPSPLSTLTQEVGLTEITVTYSRPGIKGRKIFGDLVPYGKMWRTGANSPTKIKFDKKIKLAGNEIEAGEYAMLSIPGESDWEIIINKNLGTYPQNHDPADDVVRFKVSSKKIESAVESFTIDFQAFTADGANMILLWENTAVVIPVEVTASEEVMKTIERVMNGPSSRDLYLSARYYYENDKDISKATDWINKSVEMDQEKPKFWVIHWQAKILAKSGDTKGAIKAAEQSKKLAEEEEYDAYIKMNDELIKELSSKK